jgi:hypothetical protein
VVRGRSGLEQGGGLAGRSAVMEAFEPVIIAFCCQA